MSSLRDPTQKNSLKFQLNLYDFLVLGFFSENEELIPGILSVMYFEHFMCSTSDCVLVLHHKRRLKMIELTLKHLQHRFSEFCFKRNFIIES